MPPNDIVFAPNAERELKKLSRDKQKRIFRGLREWCDGETVPDIEKIQSQPDFLRVRVGDFRLIYYPLTSDRALILVIRDRKNAYRNLGDLSIMLKTAKRRIGMAG